MKVVLEVVAGPENGRVFKFLEADSFVAGRSPKAHFVLDPKADRKISRTHFMIDVRPPRCLIRDLESKNGTFVNNRRIAHHELDDGDEVRIGQTVISVGISETNVMAPTVPVEQIAPKEIDQRPVGPARAMSFQCAGCDRDLTSKATSDGWAEHLPQARYMCPTCTIRERSANVDRKRVGNYRVLRELGRGGMGVVFKAVHESTRRICAVKQILPDAARDEKARRMFDREVGVQSMVVHPNLARVLERGRDGDSCFFVTEFLEGGDTNRLVTKEFAGPVDPPLACRIAFQILTGVDALHQHGFVHRDLKPPNFLLSRHHTDPTAITKITDYGLAKSYEEAGNSMFDYTRAGDMAGSMMFMPPEQITDYRFVRPPTDVYAVGVSLYFMLTASYTVDFPNPGQPLAFAGGGAKGRNPIQVILEDPPIPIGIRLPDLPKQIARVVDTAVQKDLGRRFPTAAVFAEELDRAMREEGLS